MTSIQTCWTFIMTVCWKTYITKPFRLSAYDTDSRVSLAGEDVPRYLRIENEMLKKLTTFKDETFVLTRHTIQEEGYLAGIELIVAKPGPIRILVGSETIY